MQSGVAEIFAQMSTVGYLRTVNLRNIALRDCRDIVQTWAGNGLCEWSPQNGITPDCLKHGRDVAEMQAKKSRGSYGRLWMMLPRNPDGESGGNILGYRCKSLPSRSKDNSVAVLHLDGQRDSVKAAA